MAYNTVRQSEVGRRCLNKGERDIFQISQLKASHDYIISWFRQYTEKFYNKATLIRAQDFIEM